LLRALSHENGVGHASSGDIVDRAAREPRNALGDSL
jgi:hypothetical protein